MIFDYIGLFFVGILAGYLFTCAVKDFARKSTSVLGYRKVEFRGQIMTEYDRDLILFKERAARAKE